MERPALTVKLGNGITYDAVAIFLHMNGTVTFVCSGNPITVQAADIKSVEYHKAGAQWCGMCDQSITHYAQPGTQ